MLLCLRQRACFPLLCSSLLWKRCVRHRMTLLSRRPCTHQGFPGNPRQCRSRQLHRRSLLLTAVAPPSWCHCHRSWPRRPLLLLLLPSRFGSRRGARERHPFRMPPAVLAVPVASEGVPGSGPPGRVPRPLQVGGCLSVHWRHWHAIGAESWVLSVLQDGYCIPFVDSPPLARTPISFPTYQSGSPRSLVLGQEIKKMLVKDALQIVLDPGPGF